MSSISLISVVRNEQENIERMLRSILGVVDEIIIIDQQSEDQTREVATKLLQRYRVPTIWEMSNHVGYAELSRQRAIDLASGDYVLLLDGDEMFNLSSLSGFNRDAYILSRKTVIHLNGAPCIEYSDYEQLRFCKRSLAFHHNDIHWTMSCNTTDKGLIREAILEVKTVEETLADYQRYEAHQSRDFQRWMIEVLSRCIKHGPPSNPVVAPFWGKPEDW